MSRRRKNNGFSLTEMLLSIGVLSVGMIFIAGVFPVAIHFSTVSTERTIAAVVVDEAIAKIKIYAIGDLYDPNDDIDISGLSNNELRDFNNTDIFPATSDITPDEFAYPSDPNINLKQKQYYWSALCRRSEIDPNSLVQVTVFVCRKVAQHLQYYEPDANTGMVNWPTPDYTNRPVPVKIEVDQPTELRPNELRIDNSADEDLKNFINDGYTIADDETGWIYRVLKRYPGDNDTIILLDKDWDGDSSGEVWVVPPPVNGSRGPCIAVYQRAIPF